MITPKVGEIYYDVSFYGSSLKIPSVQPLLFLGMNLLPEEIGSEEGEQYCFQVPGVVADPAGVERIEGAGDYFTYSKDDLQSLHTLSGAIAMLSLVASGVDLCKDPREWVF